MVARDFGAQRVSKIDEVVAKWTLENYVASCYGSLFHRSERGGARLWYHSPFRDEDSASFMVEPGKGKYRNGLWHDFADSSGGTIFDLVMRQYNLSEFKDTFTYLLGADMPKPVVMKRAKPVIPMTDSYSPPLTMDMVKRWHIAYQSMGIDYWEQRGLSRQTIHEQLLGMEEGTTERWAEGKKWVFKWRRATLPYFEGQQVVSLQRRLDDDYIMERINGEDEEAFATVKYALHDKKVKEGRKIGDPHKDALAYVYGAKYLRYTDGKSEHYPAYNINLLYKRDELGRVLMDETRNPAVPLLEYWDTMLVVEGEIKAAVMCDYGYPSIFIKAHAKIDFAWLFSKCRRVVIVRDGDEAGDTQAESLYAAIGPKACIATPLAGFKGPDDMCVAGKIDKWAQNNSILPYFIPRARRGGTWSGTAVNARTI